MSEPRVESDRKQLLRKALDAIEQLQGKLDAVERERREPIAVVGMACRFPGAPDLEAYDRLLAEGREAVSKVSSDRWDVERFFDPDPKAPGKMHAPYGGFLTEIDRFDAAFFGISGREAESMDPQQRMLLETAWTALEHAGIPAEKLRGSPTGIFVGITTSDYARLSAAGDGSRLDAYAATGGALNAAAGRLAYFFGSHGPTMAVDTACSSSLVAVHLACQSLRAKESDLALAGGVNAILSPEPFICFAKWGMMAPDGRCKTFDALADGFVRGEGCGVVVLKRLSDARRAGDRILALVRGSAVNQDGASSGLTVPNGLAQRAVLRAAMGAAGVQPLALDYVEAHGTGTTLGDPIELEAIAAVLGAARPASSPLRVGSVKTNIGHLESASGIAGLIKVVLALQREEIPAHLHFQALNPKISLGGAPIEIPVAPTPWRRGERARLAGVSSFGFSGTNAHCVLEEAPAEEKPATPESPVPRQAPHLLVLSARSEVALRQLAERYAGYLSLPEAPDKGDVCYSAAVGRSALPYRCAVVADEAGKLIEELGRYGAGSEAPGVLAGRVGGSCKVAFLFTGQGAQYAGMGREFYRGEPVFKAAFDRCATLLEVQLEHRLVNVLGYEGGAETAALAPLLDETLYTQTGLFALEYALASLWRAWGIEPAAVAGHSLGEYVAACVAGALSLEDAVRLVLVRSRLMQALPRNGAMLAVLGAEEVVRKVVVDFPGVAVASVNSPANVVISGPQNSVRAAGERLEQAGLVVKPLVVSHAFHSALMEPILDEFEQAISGITSEPPRLDLASNVTGALVDDQVSLDARYWRSHLRGTVRFADSVRLLYSRGIRAFVEIGPAPVLTGMARQCLTDGSVAFLPSLRRGQDAWRETWSSLAALFVRGLVPDWPAVYAGWRGRRVSLPSYPFQRERFWLPAPEAGKAAGPAPVRGDHPLLGMYVPVAARPGEHLWMGRVSLETSPWLDDHRVQGIAVVPATAYIETAIAAATTFGAPPFCLRQIEIGRVLQLRAGERFDYQTRMVRSEDGLLSFEIHSRPAGSGGDWTPHARGTVQMGGGNQEKEVPAGLDIEAVKARCARRIGGEQFYRCHRERGNQWGPCFQGVDEAWMGEGESLGQVVAAPGIEGNLGAYQFHPALSDSAGHVLTATIPLEPGDGPLGGAFVGAGIEEIRFYRRPAGGRLWTHAVLRRDTALPANVLLGDVRVYDETGAMVAETLGARLWYLDSAQRRSLLESPDDWLYEPCWLPAKPVEAAVTSAAGAWVLFRDSGGYGDALKQALEGRGIPVVCVDRNEGAEGGAREGGQVRPGVARDYDEALASIQTRVGRVAQVIHLWALDVTGVEAQGAAAADSAESYGPVSVLLLAQAMARASAVAGAKLWLVSCGAQPAGEMVRGLAVLQAPLWGLGRTLAVEASDLWGGVVDLDPSDSKEASAARLVAHVLNPGGEDQIAFRRDERLALRLARHTVREVATRASLRADPEGLYLITGGLGGIGLEIAKWLAAKGARHLVLAGRRRLPPRSEWAGLPAGSEERRRVEIVDSLERDGVKVTAQAVDMGDEASVRTLVQGCLAGTTTPLRGVFHAAGVMQYAALAEQNPDDLRQVLAAKLRGGWLLHNLLAGTPLDWFVLFSSSSALLSSPMMGGYSAANVFLDALAHHRRSLGLPALSVNWGTWSEAGMATRFQSSHESGRQGRSGQVKGVGTLRTQQALSALERLLAEQAIQAGVMPIDWGEWARSYRALAGVPYLSLLMKREGAPESAVSQAAGSGTHRAGILALPVEERPAATQRYLLEMMARILRLPVASLDPERPLPQLGFDSLMSIELRNQIEREVGVKLAMARLIQGPSTAELAGWLLDDLAAAPSAASDSVPGGAEADWEEGVV